MRATQKSRNPWRAWVAGGAAGSGVLLGLLEPDLPGLSCSWGRGNGLAWQHGLHSPGDGRDILRRRVWEELSGMVQGWSGQGDMVPFSGTQ